MTLVLLLVLTGGAVVAWTFRHDLSLDDLPHPQASTRPGSTRPAGADGGSSRQRPTGTGRARLVASFRDDPGTGTADSGNITVDPSGHIWTSDSYGSRINEFDATGRFLRAITLPEESFRTPNISALAAGDGHVFVCDGGDIRAYSRSGGTQDYLIEGSTELAYSDVAVNPDGTVYGMVAGSDEVLVVLKGGRDTGHWAKPMSGLGTGDIGISVAITADSHGRVFMTSVWGHQVYRFDGAGHLQHRFGRLGLDPGEVFMPEDIAVTGDGRVFILDRGGTIEWFSLDGTFQGQLVLEDLDNIPRGIAVSPDGTLYVSTDGHMVLAYAT